MIVHNKSLCLLFRTCQEHWDINPVTVFSTNTLSKGVDSKRHCVIWWPQKNANKEQIPHPNIQLTKYQITFGAHYKYGATICKNWRQHLPFPRTMQPLLQGLCSRPMGGAQPGWVQERSSNSLHKGDCVNCKQGLPVSLPSVKNNKGWLFANKEK